MRGTEVSQCPLRVPLTRDSCLRGLGLSHRSFVTSTEVPALGVFLGYVFAFGNSEIVRELIPRFLCYPTTVPILAIRQKAFCELVPLTRAITNTSSATAI